MTHNERYAAEGATVKPMAEAMEQTRAVLYGLHRCVLCGHEQMSMVGDEPCGGCGAVVEMERV